MAPAIISKLLSSPAIPARINARIDIASLGPLAARSVLVARNEHNAPNRNPEKGLVHPEDINNNAIFALFGILGAGIVCLGIWFFFWARNGGFYFKEGDWDDYVSTVTRRKGPNGTIYSDVTPSTILGGGSIYKDVQDHDDRDRDGRTDLDATTVITETTGISGISGITGGVSDIVGREKRRKKREQKEREKERRREEKAREKEEKKRGKSRRKVGADGILIDEEAEAQAKEQLRNYRHEKPARVGGINKESEGSQWDGSTNPSWSGVGASTVESGSTVTSDLLSDQQPTPTKKETSEERRARREEREKERSSRSGEKSEGRSGGGIRKVYSTADKMHNRENERIRAEARKLQEKGRAAHRRDFSWQRADAESSLLSRALRPITEGTESVVSGTSYGPTESQVSSNTSSTAPLNRPSRTAERESRVPGSWTESEVSASDAGTKVYRHSHHIPLAPSTTATSDFAYTEDKRKKRGGAGARRQRDAESSVSGV